MVLVHINMKIIFALHSASTTHLLSTDRMCKNDQGIFTRTLHSLVAVPRCENGFLHTLALANLSLITRELEISHGQCN